MFYYFLPLSKTLSRASLRLELHLTLAQFPQLIHPSFPSRELARNYVVMNPLTLVPICPYPKLSLSRDSKSPYRAELLRAQIYIMYFAEAHSLTPLFHWAMLMRTKRGRKSSYWGKRKRNCNS